MDADDRVSGKISLEFVVAFVPLATASTVLMADRSGHANGGELDSTGSNDDWWVKGETDCVENMNSEVLRT